MHSVHGETAFHLATTELDQHILVVDDLGQKIRVSLDWKFLADPEIQ
jgi:hypothetical protein